LPLYSFQHLFEQIVITCREWNDLDLISDESVVLYRSDQYEVITYQLSKLLHFYSLA